jgi:hypothetical protein
VPIYSQQNFEQIATALGISVDDVVRYRQDFEAAARWYRLNIPPEKRQAGPTYELRNHRSKEPKELSDAPQQGSGDSEHISAQRGKARKIDDEAKPRTLFELRRKARKVEAAARKLLLHLGVRHHAAAPDGPGDTDLLVFLASFSGASEEQVISDTARVGRLAELMEALNAIQSIEACAFRAAQEASDFAKLLPQGHCGDIAAIGWTSDMMSLFEKITGKEARFSVFRPGPGRGRPTGRFLRFLEAACEPLETKFSPATTRSRQRALKRPTERRQK